MDQNQLRKQNFKEVRKLLNIIYTISKCRYSKMCDRSQVLYESAVKSIPLSNNKKKICNKFTNAINQMSEVFDGTYNKLLTLGVEPDTIDEYLFYNRDMFGVSIDNPYYKSSKKKHGKKKKHINSNVITYK